MTPNTPLPWELPTEPVDPQPLSRPPREGDEPGYIVRVEAFLNERLGYPQVSEAADAPTRQRGGSMPGTLSPDAPPAEAPDEGPTPPSFPSELARERLDQLRRLDALRSSAEGGGAVPGTLSAEAPQPAPAFERAGIPPTNFWVPIGPSATRFGQGGTRPTVSGRVAGIAVTPGGRRIYAATANGGVWRSEDRGETWTSLMDAFDLNPAASQSTSQSCGAIAVVPGRMAAEDCVFVGSGEGTSSAYFGVGPIVSFDGGENWLTEPTEGGDLVGSAFYQLALDATDDHIVYGATQRGLYRRQRTTGRHGRWHNLSGPAGLHGAFTSVVCHPVSGSTYAARSWGGVYRLDGQDLIPVGAGFPETDVRRVGLAMHPVDPSVLYALIVNNRSHFGGLLRLDLNDGVWRSVDGVPPTLFGHSLNFSGQGWYDLALAVSPDDVNRLVLGGAAVFDGNWSAALYRCQVDSANHTTTAEYIGRSAHADVHALVFEPGDGERLWVGCDGGVFATEQAASGSGDIFTACNTGLQTMTMNHIGQHPTDPNVLFCGTQDNGGQRYTGEPCWLLSNWGDSGYFVVNWADPNVVIDTYTYAFMRKSVDGGDQGTGAGRRIPLERGDRSLFYAPLVGTPFNPSRPVEAERIAFGGNRIWLSDDFGDSWMSLPNNRTSDRLPQGDIAQSLLFAGHDLLYVGTIFGRVYRFRYSSSARRWFRTDLRFHHRPEAQNLPVTDMAVDPNVPSGEALYVVLGGMAHQGPTPRVLRYDGRRWESVSGSSADPSQNLLGTVHHKAIVVDPLHPDHIYIGTDIGVWRSLDRGTTWQPFSHGLPDSAVMDLKLHEANRLLRVSTHGRGLYQLHLDAAERAVDLYLRPVEEPYPRTGQPFFTEPGSPDIKLMSPTQPGEPITDFVAFSKLYHNPWLPTNETYRITSQVHVQVHNRGRFAANQVRVVLLLAKLVDGSMPPLPRGYDVAIRQGLEISSATWQTVGSLEVDDVRTGRPRIVSFDLASDLFEPGQDYDVAAGKVVPAAYAVVACLHHVDDPYTAPGETTAVDSGNRKAGFHKFYRFLLPDDFVPEPRVARDPSPFTEMFKARHVVTAGQSLADIAALFYTVDEMAEAIYEVNREAIGPDPTDLAPGTELRIPASLRVVLDGGWREEAATRPRYLAEHVVVPGNTLAGIANRYYGSSVREKWMVIYEANRDVIGPNPGLIRPGMVLKIPYLDG